jgi:hypothetical protein
LSSSLWIGERADISDHRAEPAQRRHESAEDETLAAPMKRIRLNPTLGDTPMKSLALAIVVALSTIATGAIAAPADGNTLTVHGVFGGNDDGR